jgi:hypothetical protein
MGMDDRAEVVSGGEQIALSEGAALSFALDWTGDAARYCLPGMRIGASLGLEERSVCTMRCC